LLSSKKSDEQASVAVTEPDPLNKDIDFTPYVKVGNLLLFKELVAIEITLPMPVMFFGLLESQRAQEFWGKEDFQDIHCPTWANGLSFTCMRPFLRGSRGLLRLSFPRIIPLPKNSEKTRNNCKE